MAETVLTRLALFGEDMALIGFIAFHLTTPGYLEALFGAAVGLHLRHMILILLSHTTRRGSAKIGQKFALTNSNWLFYCRLRGGSG